MATASGTARRSDGLTLGVPAYADPDVYPSTWTGLLALPPGSAVVLNPDSGSGRRHDDRYTGIVDRMRMAGIEVFGYVDTDYGQRSAEAVMADMAQHVEWFRVDGVFFDQVPGTGEHLEWYGRLAAVARSRRLRVALNMGQPRIDPGFADIADVLGVFEGDGDAHAGLVLADWMNELPCRARLWHMVYDVHGEPAMREVVARAVALGCDVIYVTDGSGLNPWIGLPGYWDAELALIAGAVDARGQ